MTTLVGGGRNAGDLESAVAEYIDWFNHRRLHGEIGLVLPAEQEASFTGTTMRDYRRRGSSEAPLNPVRGKKGR